MILCLDTSTPVCHLSLIENDWQVDAQWESGRQLASGLLGYIQEQLSAHDKDWQDITGLVVYQGPGSFTGLRIGITVLNTLAYANSIPIVGVTGDEWRADGVQRLRNGENDEMVLPEYGGEANITTPRK